MKEEINNAVKTLNDSLLYQMSLGSRELYHSNVWAWLMKKDSRYIKVFFDSFDSDKYDEVKIERESHHRDVVVFLKGKNDDYRYLVVENKIKSLPNREQLERYNENLKYNKQQYKQADSIYTGIIQTLKEKVEIPNGVGEKKVWVWVGYENIAKRIRECTDEIFDDKDKDEAYLKQVIIEYCNNINDTVKLLKEALSHDPEKYHYACDSNLKEVRLGEIFIKLKAALFLNYVKEHFMKKLEEARPLGFDDDIFGLGFSHGNAIIDIAYGNKVKNEKTNYTRIGIQLQGNEFRWFVESDIASIESIFNKLKGSWFKNYDKESKIIDGRKTVLSDESRQFGKTFIFQYYSIDVKNSQSSMTYNEIAELIVERMKSAAAAIAIIQNQ